MGESSFVGLDNYVRALRDPAFHRAIIATVGYTAVTVIGQLILGLAAALLLNERIRGRAVLRLVYYLPVISSWVIVSLIFVWIYNGQTGILNYLLNDVLGVIDTNVAWLAEPATALWAIAVLGIRKGSADHGGLPGRPADGARGATGRRHRLCRRGALPCRDHPVPALTTTFLLVVLTIGSFSTFVPIYVMSSATGIISGPSAAQGSPDVHLEAGIGGSFDFAYAAALSFLVAGIVALISVFELRPPGRRASHDGWTA
jgi:multiple sugar transport system permease protein